MSYLDLICLIQGIEGRGSEGLASALSTQSFRIGLPSVRWKALASVFVGEKQPKSKSPKNEDRTHRDAHNIKASEEESRK